MPVPISLRDFRERQRQEQARILAELPEIEAAAFTLTWQLETAPDRPAWVIKHGDTVVYREPARREGYHRFELLAHLLRQRYGDRIRDLVPVSHPEADFYLYGDYLGSVARIEAARKRFGLSG